MNDIAFLSFDIFLIRGEKRQKKKKKGKKTWNRTNIQLDFFVFSSVFPKFYCAFWDIQDFVAQIF